VRSKPWWDLVRIGVLGGAVFDGDLWLASDNPRRALVFLVVEEIRGVEGMGARWSEYDRRQKELSGRFFTHETNRFWIRLNLRAAPSVLSV